MRFGNWDVTLAPYGCDIPIPEFKTEAHLADDLEAAPVHEAYSAPAPHGFPVPYPRSANDAAPDAPSPTFTGVSGVSGVVHYPPIHTQMPLLTCWVPSLRRDTPFRVIAHLWAPLQFNADLDRMKAAGRVPICQIRVFVDERNMGEITFDATIPARPFFIDSCCTVESKRVIRKEKYGPALNRAFLFWPKYRQQQENEEQWNPADDEGRIKVIISEGIKVEGSNTMVWTKNIIAFAFQHAPMRVLQEKCIAWPRDGTFWKPELLSTSGSYGVVGEAFLDNQSEADNRASPDPTAPLTDEHGNPFRNEWIALANGPAFTYGTAAEFKQAETQNRVAELVTRIPATTRAPFSQPRSASVNTGRGNARQTPLRPIAPAITSGNHSVPSSPSFLNVSSIVEYGSIHMRSSPRQPYNVVPYEAYKGANETASLPTEKPSPTYEVMSSPPWLRGLRAHNLYPSGPVSTPAKQTTITPASKKQATKETSEKPAPARVRRAAPAPKKPQAKENINTPAPVKTDTASSASKKPSTKEKTNPPSLATLSLQTAPTSTTEAEVQQELVTYWKSSDTEGATREGSPLEGPPAKRTRSHYHTEVVPATPATTEPKVPAKTPAKTPAKARAKTPAKTPKAPAKATRSVTRSAAKSSVSKTKATPAKTARQTTGGKTAGKSVGKAPAATLRPKVSQAVAAEEQDGDDEQDVKDE